MIVTGTSALILAGLSSADRRVLAPPWRTLLATVAQQAANETAGADEAVLVAWFEDFAKRLPIISLSLLDAAHDPLIGPPISADERERLLEADTGNDAEFVQWGFRHDDRDYWLVLRPAREAGIRRVAEFSALRPSLAGAIIFVAVPLSVLLSFAIARYLVRPLRTVEDAGRQMSKGDFSVRVGPSLGHRGDEIADFAAGFDDMAARIESLVGSHKLLLRDVSHELRSPLARAYAALSLARQRTDGAVSAELDRIELEIERLDSMIGRLLTFSRLDAGQRALQREPIDLEGLVSEIVHDARIEAQTAGKGVLFRADGPVTVLGEPELLASCIENIVRNAVRYTRPDTAVTITIGPEEGGRCRLTVRDYGDGVPESQLSTIFEPFRRVDEGRRVDDGGAGIGLAIARQAALLHGGTINAANAVGGGLAVTVCLPLHHVGNGERHPNEARFYPS